MKKISLVIVIFFSLNLVNVFAQDVIYKTDGTKEEVKVMLVGDNEIQYKKFSNLDGPVYVLDISNIVLITYENGDHDMLQTKPVRETKQKLDLSDDYTRNILNYHVFDVFYGDLAFSYERIIANGIMGIHVPVGFGYAYNSDYFGGSSEWIKNLAYSGAALYFYPGGQGMVRYFVGPKILVGFGKQTYWDYYYDEYGNYYDQQVSDEGIYLKYMVDNGVRFTFMRNFSFAAILSVGIRYFPEAGYSYETVMPTGHFGVNLSYRF